MDLQKTEGYWRWEREKNLPIPIPNVLDEYQAQKIYDLILEKEKEATKKLYRGFSHSRITKETLGSAEYETKDWRWPADFAPHYVLEHKVKPTKEFLIFIGYEKPNGKKNN